MPFLLKINLLTIFLSGYTMYTGVMKQENHHQVKVNNSKSS